MRAGRHNRGVAKLGGRQWVIVTGEPVAKKEWGCCYPDQRRICIDPKAPPGVAWQTLVHELWHALNPEQAEEVVEERSAEMAEVLLGYGYRFLRAARGG